jgi:hypothetical protein
LNSNNIDLDRIKSDKNAWIIKPEDGYASQGVYAGLDHDDATWAKLVDKCSKEHYIVQTFCQQYATPNSRIVPADNKWKPLFTDRETWLAAGEDFDPVKLEGWNNLTGMYVYGGKFSGLFVRAGRAGIIAGFAGGITLASFLSDYDPQAGLSLQTVRPC